MLPDNATLRRLLPRLRRNLDLVSSCCSLGSLDLRQASIPFSCLSNAIICDLRRRMSSIRRSSLISITLGLLTVIGAVFRSLMRRQDSASLEPRRAGAGRPGRQRTCPRRQLQENGALCSRIYCPSSLPRFVIDNCDGRHKLPFEYPIIFWTPRDRRGPGEAQRSPRAGRSLEGAG